MNVEELLPRPENWEPFKRNRERFVPENSGCYVLATASKEILYVGLAVNLRSRMNQHLDSLDKTSETKLGRAAIFLWLEHKDINKIERTWMNMHIQAEGALPLLNKVYSPTRT